MLKPDQSLLRRIKSEPDPGRRIDLMLSDPNFARISPANKAKLRNILLAAIGAEALDPAYIEFAAEFPAIRQWLLVGAARARRDPAFKLKEHLKSAT